MSQRNGKVIITENCNLPRKILKANSLQSLTHKPVLNENDGEKEDDLVSIPSFSLFPAIVRKRKT